MIPAIHRPPAPPAATGHANPAGRATGARRAERADPRWPQIVAALHRLRARRRRAIRIVDADCGCGTLLIATASYARSIGFVAIEGRGIDGAPAMIGRARAAAARLHDPAIGLTFDLVDMAQGLAQEAAFPADLLLSRGAADRPDPTGVEALLAAAGDCVIDDVAHGAAAGSCA